MGKSKQVSAKQNDWSLLFLGTDHNYFAVKSLTCYNWWYVDRDCPVRPIKFLLTSTLTRSTAPSPTLNSSTASSISSLHCKSTWPASTPVSCTTAKIKASASLDRRDARLRWSIRTPTVPAHRRTRDQTAQPVSILFGNTCTIFKLCISDCLYVKLVTVIEQYFYVKLSKWVCQAFIWQL